MDKDQACQNCPHPKSEHAKYGDNWNQKKCNAPDCKCQNYVPPPGSKPNNTYL